MSAAVKRYRIAGCGVLAPAGIHEYVYAQDHDEFAAQRHNEINAAYGMAIRKQAEIERLRVLLTECGAFIVTGTDEGCEPGACAECDMHRLRLRIDAALAGAAVQPSSPADGQPVAEGVARAEVVPYPYGEGRTDQPDAVLRDAERYRYMRNNASFRDRNGPGLYWYLPRFLPGGGAEQLDAAIDAELRRTADPTSDGTNTGFNRIATGNTELNKAHESEPCRWCGRPVTEQADRPADYCVHDGLVVHEHNFDVAGNCESCGTYDAVNDLRLKVPEKCLSQRSGSIDVTACAPVDAAVTGSTVNGDSASGVPE